MHSLARGLILVGVVSSACGGGARDADRAERAAATTPAADADPRACRLLTLREVETVTGLKLVPGPRGPDYPWYSRCEWSVTPGRTDGVVLVVNGQGKFSDYSTVPGSTPVTGLGLEAVWNPNVRQLAVRRDTGTVSVSFVVDEAKRTWAEQLMRTVLGRL